MKQTKVKAELEIIRKRHGGKLSPKDVVEFARNKKTALHKCFCWDDSKAAEQYRIEQARRIIQAEVTLLPSDNVTPIRAYCSLSTERGNGLKSYRLTTNVLQSDALREQLLADCARDAWTFLAKYKALANEREWKGAFSALAKALEAYNEKRKVDKALSI